MELRADLHIHTYYSDGALSPAEVVEEVKKNNVGLFAVTDHDTMLGCEEAEKLAYGCNLSIALGAEISAYDGDVKLHTLAYGVDRDKFSGFLKTLYTGSVRRAEDIIYKLNANGVNLTVEEAAAERYADKSPIHGMHIARAAAKKGYAPTPFDFFGMYMAYGKPAFSLTARPSPEETCEAISAAGGFSSVAHPGRIDMPRERFEKLIERLKDCNLGGIEVYYTTHTIEQTAYYKELAERFSLIPTGGSDTHRTGGRNEIGKPVFFAGGGLLKRLKVENGKI